MVKRFAVIPAAGTGQRYAGTLPKQYLPIAGKPVIQHTLERLLSFDDISEIVVALHPDDRWFRELIIAAHPKIRCILGGEERAESVLLGVQALQASARASDWVIVHDAVRPGLSRETWDRLWVVLASEPVGGLLAIPVRDTLKLVDADEHVVETKARANLWQAQTPQVFRFELLHRALQQFAHDHDITDEASAIEKLGLKPKVILGEVCNLKLTHPGDEIVLGHIIQS